MLGKLVLVLLSITFAAGPIASTRGQDVDVRKESKVKAVFLYSFGRYVTWPAYAEPRQLVIGIVGETPETFTQSLARIAATRKIRDRQIVVRTFASADDIAACDILFVSRTAPAESMPAILKRVGSKPVLLVGESEGFGKSGGAINFFLVDGTVRFEINADAARKRNLRMDAKLLSLGRSQSPR